MSLRARREETGSLSIELAMIAPGLLMIFALIYAYGQVGQINGTLQSGTRDAARSATAARTYEEAKARAQQAVREAIQGGPSDCSASLKVTVSHDFEPGKVVTVKSTCQFGLSQIGLPGAPGTVHAHSQFSSMLDPNRGIGP